MNYTQHLTKLIKLNPNKILYNDIYKSQIYTFKSATSYVLNSSKNNCTINQKLIQICQFDLLVLVVLALYNEVRLKAEININMPVSIGFGLKEDLKLLVVISKLK